MGTAAYVLLDVALVLAVARVLRGTLQKLRQPPVMAEVLAGLVLGASVLGKPSASLFPAEAREVLIVLGEVAIVAYLFRVGAALDLRALRDDASAVGAVAVASFVAPWLAGAALAPALHAGVAGDPPLVAFTLFLGSAISVTALPVLSRIVEARGLAERAAGRVALTAAAAQELLVWPALAVAIALGGASGSGSPLGVLGHGAAAVVIVVVLARLIVPAAAEGYPRATGVLALAGLGVAAGLTELSGLHLVLGAFLFGVLLPASPRRAAVALLRERAAVVASAIALPLFFALPALRVDLGALGAEGLRVLALVLGVAVAAKLLSAAGAARLAGLPAREALTVGALMNARGLVELVVLAVGLEAGLIDERLFAVMVVMALVTTFATGPLVDVLRRARPHAAA